MERSTQAEARKERFTRQGRIAQDLANLALSEIDEALASNVVVMEPHSELYGIWINDPSLHPNTRMLDA